ncbi:MULTISPECIES: hypothetical protein [unclassified Clostridium]|uniref:hypothetical protein n=1 Tax=Clostridium TaxID=1485 RepID=UPI000E4AD719|nr:MULTISPECIES: hypothetical protein [unclassified Clostridium]RHT74962.1 hypothetical protein DW739_10580 [Clostridium sp. AM28-20LB]RHT93923.1 hypothetical protein DW720_11915 [Clostridium sp. AM27-28]
MGVTNNVSIYFPVYKKIEKEIQELASAIYFCDEQKNVFSLDIADLIVRCLVEIESIAKDIYRIENEVEPDNPGECFKWMEQNWNISKKKVVVISPFFHFDEMKSFFPFDYKNKSEEDYYSTYNAIKHDRVKNISKATLYTLVRALGALYILNIYFKNDRIQLKDDNYAAHVDRTFGSEIFSVDIAPCKDIVVLSSEKNIIPEQCIYKIIRKESDYAFSLSYKNQFGEVCSSSLVMTNKEFQDYAASCVGKGICTEEFWDFVAKFSGMTAENFKVGFLKNNKVSEFISVRAYKMKATFWAELNK